MLTAKIRIDRELSSHRRPGALPCGPERAISISVESAAPWRMLFAWFRVNVGDKHRTDRKRTAWFLAVTFLTAVACLTLAAVAPLFQQDIIAVIPASPSAVPPSQGSNARARRVTDTTHGAADALRASPELWEWSYQVRSVATGVAGFVLLGSCLFIFFRRQLRQIYLIVVAPHQPFPVIDRDLVRRKDVDVFAVRALGLDVRRMFFRVHDNDEVGVEVYEINTVQLTHSNCRNVPPPARHLESTSYWAMIRYSIGLSLPTRKGDRVAAIEFTLRLYWPLFHGFLILVLLAIVPPGIGWMPDAQQSQYPIVLAGLAIVWALLALGLHRKLTKHLDEWERLTLDNPFRGSPLFCYSETGGLAGEWIEVRPEEFSAPIREFGMNYAAFQELLLGLMLGGYLAALQLIK